MHQYATLEDTVYLWFGANDTAGSGADGATPVFDVRLAGAAADAAPVLSGSATLLSHANYPPGAHEVAIAATTGNGFAAGNTYAVFCTLLVDSQNPTGFIGSFTLGPVVANVIQIVGGTQTVTDLKDFADTGYDPTAHKVQGVVLTDTCTTNSDMRGTDSANTVVPDAAGTVAGLHATTDALIGDVPTTAEFEARTLISGAYFNPAIDTVANVTLVGTCTTNTDMRGTDGANTVVPDAAGVVATALGLLETHGDSTWATATGFSTHDAAAVVTALGTGSTLTDCLTATSVTVSDKTGFSLSSTGADLILKSSTFALAMADAIWDEVLTGDTHNVSTSAGRRLRQLGAISIIDGVATAGTTQTITLDSDASTTASIYNENLITITGGTGAGQTRLIIEYTTGRVASVDIPWEVVPSTDSTYQVIAFSAILMATRGLAQAGGASTITLGVNALADEGSYVGCAIYISAGTGAGQTRTITAYTAGRVATVSPVWETQPDNTSIYKVLPVARSIVDSMSTAAISNIVTAMETDGTKLDHLWEMTEDDGGVRRYTTNALEQAPSSGLDAAGIRTAIGLTSANLDTQLGDIPTVAEFEARTLVAADYFDPVNDAVANVTLVTTCTTNSDMRGTDGANTVVPDVAGTAASLIGGLNDISIADIWTAAGQIDGKTPTQALQIIAALCAGIVSGAGTGTEVFKGLDKLTTRVTVTVDESGNRSNVVYG